MNCKKIQELLLTDYLDKEADVKIRVAIQRHLGECSACKDFEERLRLSAVSPFKNSVTPKVPPEIWLNIKDQILERQSSKLSLVDVIRERLKIFSLPRPALAYASAIAISLIIIGVFVKYNADRSQIRDYFSQQVEFYDTFSAEEENGNSLVDASFF